MKKTISIFFLLATLATYPLFSQNFRVELPPGYNKILPSNPIPGKAGNPYLVDEWLPGTILLKNGKRIDSLKYRYCVYNKQMQFQLENTAYMINAPDSVKELWIGKRLFVYLNFTKGDEMGKDFFEVQVDGKAKFLVRYGIEIIPANYNEAMAVGEKNDKITIKETYYLQRDNESAFPIDRKGKNVKLVLADRTEKIIDFIKKENISFKNKKDLTLLIGYYNSVF